MHSPRRELYLYERDNRYYQHSRHACTNTARLHALSSKPGAHKAVKAIFWSWYQVRVLDTFEVVASPLDNGPREMLLRNVQTRPS
jgi:hypothetical protein